MLNNKHLVLWALLHEKQFVLWAMLNKKQFVLWALLHKKQFVLWALFMTLFQYYGMLLLNIICSISLEFEIYTIGIKGIEQWLWWRHSDPKIRVQFPFGLYP